MARERRTRHSLKRGKAIGKMRRHNRISALERRVDLLEVAVMNSATKDDLSALRADIAELKAMIQQLITKASLRQYLKMPHAMETCYGSRLHCAAHNEDEPDTNAYRVCLECWHVYRTPDELILAWKAEGFAFDRVDEIRGCAYCGHDWLSGYGLPDNSDNPSMPNLRASCLCRTGQQPQRIPGLLLPQTRRERTTKPEIRRDGGGCRATKPASGHQPFAVALQRI